MYKYFNYILFSHFESIEMYEAKNPISTNLTWPANCLFIFIP